MSSQPFQRSFCQAAVLSYVPTWIHLRDIADTDPTNEPSGQGQHALAALVLVMQVMEWGLSNTLACQ